MKDIPVEPSEIAAKHPHSTATVTLEEHPDEALTTATSGPSPSLSEIVSRAIDEGEAARRTSIESERRHREVESPRFQPLPYGMD